ncbi:quinone-dependent dihydroorotate dehydrogenase [Arthrobacter antibioticus]|uniref:quinone-dependent dihydroorotate dehydrogenase n=1 Tax=Arthrobacter sp. H35-MC1 TaxID=3046203 RepID=UPI0024BBB61A|nr:quinone-dependent dihydroorotate dehydrogenase [Arthrobacter sp. H35-MC1]MDJ0315867.1 quinone-dependent dihydroorotate dehydrogenase [Arthrobacter sp. H35-MC1]
MRIYPTVFRLCFSWMDAERAHKIGFCLVKATQATGAGAVLRRMFAPPASLQTQALGLTFPTPFGLAAGFDKEGKGINALANLGFGHVEVGTITAQAQSGNPQPRLFRLVADRAVINRMGFNNDGAATVAPRLAQALAGLGKSYSSVRPIVGVNIGKTKTVELEDALADYLLSASTLAPSADYLVVNVSSPNTPGLRLLQDVATLRPLLTGVREAADTAAGRHVPLLVKIAPDLADADIADVAALALELELDGIIATNTTISRDGLASTVADVAQTGAGGLSGAPLKARSLEVLRQLKAAVNDQLTLISVGGVETGAEVQERLDAGATLVQGYTAFLYEGPFWAARINKELVQLRRAKLGQ